MSDSVTPEHVAGGTPDDSSAQNSLPGRDLSGQVLGDFRVERLLGRGGMGEVYLAQQISLERPAALKVLKPELLSNPISLARFEKEALTAARLNHPNIVHIYSFGAVDDTKYIAMEYVKGTNLREYLKKKLVPDLPVALSIMRQAGQAVGAAGEQGLVHRDIKPENLLLTRKGQVKVADFGLCRTPGSEALHLTQQGVTLGTPMYMSPEQVQGRELDHRSDLYSLGVTFYHMLSGAPPFRADGALALALKHVRETPVNLAVHRPDLPPELVQLVMKLLEKDPANRYQSAAEMLRDLAKIRESMQASTGPVSLAESVSEGNGTVEPITRADDLPMRPKPSRSAMLRLLSSYRPGGRTLAIVSAVAVVVGALLGYRDRSPDLLGEHAPQTEGPTGLWLAPWSNMERQETPELQYRYAQLRAPAIDREAAWLAVPGYHPGSADWASHAYVQLVRTLFRHHDADGLEQLGAGLADSSRPADQTLARIARAGAASLRGDADALVSQFAEGTNIELMDPTLLELTLEIALHAQPSREPGGSGPLNRLIGELRSALQVGPLQGLGGLRFG